MIHPGYQWQRHADWGGGPERYRIALLAHRFAGWWKWTAHHDRFRGTTLHPWGRTLKGSNNPW